MTRTLSAMVLALALTLVAPTARALDDPLESFNRMMFSFNAQVVEHVIDPLAMTFEEWLPAGVRQAAGNVYSNMTEPEFIITNLFSKNYDDAGVSASRFLVNTTIGLGGLFDPATSFGLIRRETEFGESLCVLGVPTAPYIVLPLIGSTNAWAAGLLTGFFAVEWYALSLISSLLATADLVVDLSASAASLRHAGETPDLDTNDPYALQRSEYHEYIQKGCAAGQVRRDPSVVATTN